MNQEQITKTEVRWATPNVNIYEDENKFTFQVDLPGIKESEVKIEIENDILSITAKKEVSEISENLVYREYKESSYFRKFILNQKIDESNTKAKMKNGRLILELPKLKPELKKISIQVN
jgi:HSP20 family protein